jgi:N6-L-threonylcarbamoyladenine synthase
VESIIPVLEGALTKAKIEASDLDAIAVTNAPGLLGSLLVGTITARAISAVWKKPLIPVHHTLGHLSSVWLQEKETDDQPVFPVLTLSVSGGHSDIWYRESHTKGQRIGTTRDDAAGEAFDKGASLLGLPYPGGPALAKLADKGDETKYPFPLPLKSDDSFDFSFSGLKTSLKYLLRDEKSPDLASVAASYQLAISKHLEDRLSKALEKFPQVKELHVVGGVSANTRLRTMLGELCKTHQITFRVPSSLLYCTDNAAMIAAAGYFLAQENPKVLNATFETLATQKLI